MSDAHPRELLEASLAGELTGAAKERLAAHLKTCPECAAEARFGRQLRAAAVSPAPADLDRVERRVFAVVTGRRPAADPWIFSRPALAGALAAACGLLFLASGGPRWAGDRLTVRQSVAMGDEQGRERLIREAFGTAKPAGRTKTRILAEFRGPASLAGLVFGGTAAPRLTSDGVMGLKALELGPAGSQVEPLELAVPCGRPGPADAQAVVVWARAAGGEARATLSVVLADGRVVACPPARSVGEAWSWVAFPLPPEAQTAAPREFRLAFTGSGTVAIARVDAWCGSAAGEGE